MNVAAQVGRHVHFLSEGLENCWPQMQLGRLPGFLMPGCDDIGMLFRNKIQMHGARISP
jgi:hypothetical protein